MYIGLTDLEKRNTGEVEQQVFRTRELILAGMRVCEGRKPIVKHTAREAAHCLNRARHVLQDGDVSEPE